MKRILGLDLGTNSIGWALVDEAEYENEKSSIIKLGVRVNPLSTDEQSNFEKGKSITTNADRTLKRSMRRSLQRYKHRREMLIQVLKEYNLIKDTTLLSENGNFSTFETYKLRAKAANEKVTLEEFGRILLMINKKRGYKSSRKVKSQADGQIIDGMEIAKKLYNENITPGQLCLQLLNNGKKNLPDFYRSDLKEEFDKIWEYQKQFYKEILIDELKVELTDKNRGQTWKICEKPFNVVGLKRNGNRYEQKLENFKWREIGLSTKLDLEELVIVLQEINSQIYSSSGYLGEISDRSKELYFKKQTIGEYLQSQIEKDSHVRLKGQVFYRQDYMDEFDKIWEKQSQYHSELTIDLKKEIRDIVIFYQRKLKSQKGLISFCEFESKEMKVVIDGKLKTKTFGSKVCPRSSPLFQDFKIWQILNNIEVVNKKTNQKTYLDQEQKELLYKELSFKEKLSKGDALRLVFENIKDVDLNFQNIEGNKTQAALYKVYAKIIEISGHGEYNFEKMHSSQIYKIVFDLFTALNINTEILRFESNKYDEDFQKHPMFQLWHLLYSFEGDDSVSGNKKLIQKISDKFGFEYEFAQLLANVTFQDDYGSLSTKAIRKILPHLFEGNEFSVACTLAGYRHSKNSLNKEEIANKILKDKLEVLPKNSLRNPVVEKIINQMINVINSISEFYGKPDEIRIELARELKKSAEERTMLTSSINRSTSEHENIRKILQSEFGFSNVSRNDIIKYKLYEELAFNGFQTLYSNTYIPREKLFSKEFDIEHIIPQSRLFDDSFSNKTIELRSINIEKGNDTAFDYVKMKYGEEGLANYLLRLEEFLKSGEKRKTKYNKLKMKGVDIPDDFIERDLRDTQYIAKKAKSILESYVKDVVSTSGLVTDRLREDWQLIDVMKELNWNKYDSLGLTEEITNRDGLVIKRIKDWSKRNDHRHHAMDALTVAFTKRSYIQYLNNLNARSDKSKSIYGIETKELYRDDKGKLKFKPPIPINEFRFQAKKQLESILVSYKAKNKIVTNNVNKTLKKKGFNIKNQLTPRGQLHNETIYGCSQKCIVKEIKVGSVFNEELIKKVSNPTYQNALLERLIKFENDSKKAFSGKNSIDKNPIWLDDLKTKKVPEKVKIVQFENIFTIRKEISPDLKIEKVVDKKIKEILEQRLREFSNEPKKAFVNLDENPIWLNKEKKISIKSVTITGVSNAIALHDKKDKEGRLLLGENGKPQGVDFVNTGNNHHVAIYIDEKGNLQEKVVSFFEATERVNQKLPIIDKEYKISEGWEFLFSLKQNEYFVFPNEKTGFNPDEIDLLNPENYHIISPNLYRVQKLTSKDYFFRHHLETNVEYNEKLKGIVWLRLGINSISKIIKVRTNHIGHIVSIGEY